MIARGHEVVLLCPAEARILAEAPRFGVPAQAAPIGRKGIAGLLALRRLIGRLRPDVVNTHSSTDTWLVALARLLMFRPPPLVRTRHISAPVSPNAASRWLYARATTRVVTTGEQLRRSLIEQTGISAGRVSSIPTGIDAGRFHPGDPIAARRALGLSEEGPWIGIVATLRSWKGHLYLLDAFARLRTPGARLLIVGDGPMREVLAERVRALGIGERVVMAGERREPEYWMRAFDLFCLPSYANEGVPQALMQAMLCGLPVITTPVGAIPEIIADGRTGILVPARDAGALASAIDLALADPDGRAALGRAARLEALEHFGYDRMIERMEAVFGDAVASVRAA
jgi:glycosyltransferase involved in cell wall biosynthesis